MTDERLRDIVRAALPAVTADAVRRDRWPDIVDALEHRRRWSLLDLSLAAALAIALTLFPEWLWLVVYHL